MTHPFTTSEDAEEAFYEAIGRADVDALMSVWADDEEIVCIHPTGQRLAGAAAIRESWRNVFATNPRFAVHVRRKVRWESLLIAVHSVVETLHLGNDPTQHGQMLSTNVFTRAADGWRLLSRHTSTAEDHAEADGNGPEHLTGPHTLH